MFRRRRDTEPTALVPRISPTEGRPFSYSYPEEQDSEERTSRVEGHYLVESQTGADYNVTELTMGRTVTMPEGERQRIRDIKHSLDDLSRWMTDRTSHDTPRIAKYLIEYPRHNREDPIDAIVIAAQNGAIHWYDAKEVNGTVLITGRREEFDDKTVIAVPHGARITTSIRGREPAGDTPIVNAGEPSYEETLMEEIHGAIIDYNSAHPGK